LRNDEYNTNGKFSGDLLKTCSVLQDLVELGFKWWYQNRIYMFLISSAGNIFNILSFTIYFLKLLQYWKANEDGLTLQRVSRYPILAAALGLQSSLRRLREPNLNIGKFPLRKLHIWEVTWEVALGKISLGKYLTPTRGPWNFKNPFSSFKCRFSYLQFHTLFEVIFLYKGIDSLQQIPIF